MFFGFLDKSHNLRYSAALVHENRSGVNRGSEYFLRHFKLGANLAHYGRESEVVSITMNGKLILKFVISPFTMYVQDYSSGPEYYKLQDNNSREMYTSYIKDS